MKQLYTTIIFLAFNLFSFGQTDFIGNWYLHYIDDNGSITNVPDGIENIPSINFTEEFNTLFNSYIFNGNGDCNGFIGSYLSSNNTIQFTEDFGYTLVLCNSNSDFEPLYFNILGDSSTNNFEYEFSNDNQNMTLTDLSGRQLVYGRVPLINELMGEWFLYSLEIDGIEEIVPAGMSPTINFKNAFRTRGLRYDGIAVCNGFEGDYYVTSDNLYYTNYPTTTLGMCTTVEEAIYEDLYLNDLLMSSLNTTYTEDYFSYQVSGTGDDANLTITNTTNGNIGHYGRLSLSTINLDSNNFSIRLKENPVNTLLNIIIDGNSEEDLSYSIFSIDGKQISSESQLNANHQINISQLETGLYFLNINNANNKTTILKFVKK